MDFEYCSLSRAQLGTGNIQSIRQTAAVSPENIQENVVVIKGRMVFMIH